MTDFRNIESLRAFTSRILSEEFLVLFQSKVNYDIAPLIPIIQNYTEESEFGLRLISRYPLEKMSVLEVGAGAGILTAWLGLNGIRITGIEPSGIGYDFHGDLKEAIWSYFSLPGDLVKDLGVQHISRLEAKYDFIFSLNVLEHIPYAILEPAFQGMKSALNLNGMMLHHCPNYFIPFEPHYGFPLIPFIPQLSGKLMGVEADGVWQSLNFITYSKVKRMARKAGLRIIFHKGVMYDTFNRLEEDEVFAGRHKTLSRVYPVLRKLGLNLFLKNVPPALSTPMTFTCKADK